MGVVAPGEKKLLSVIVNYDPYFAWRSNRKQSDSSDPVQLRTGECEECFREFSGPHPNSMPTLMPVTFTLHGVQKAKHKR